MPYGLGELDDSGLRARHLFDSHFRVVASPEYLAKHGTPQSAEDLANHQCLGFTEPGSLNTWAVLDAQGNPYKISPHFTASSGESYARCAFQVAVLLAYQIFWLTTTSLKES